MQIRGVAIGTIDSGINTRQDKRRFMSLCVLLETSTAKFYLRAIKVDRVVKRSIQSLPMNRQKLQLLSKEWLHSFTVLIENFMDHFDTATVCWSMCFTISASRFPIRSTQPARPKPHPNSIITNGQLHCYCLFSPLPSRPATFRSLLHPSHANAPLLNIIQAGSEYEIV